MTTDQTSPSEQALPSEQPLPSEQAVEHAPAAEHPTQPERPGVAGLRPYAFPVPERFTLANGLRVMAFHCPGQYLVSLRLVLPVPLATEPRDREGVAGIMARTMDEGTSTTTGAEFAALLERRGVAFGAGFGERGMVVEVDVAASRLAGALPLMVDALADPAFREEDVARLVHVRLADIDFERSSGGSRAALEFIRWHFAEDDRGSRPAGGTAETVAAITADDVRAFHSAYVWPDGGLLAVAGDLSGLDLQRQLDETLGRWAGPHAEGAQRRETTLPREVVSPDRQRVVLVDRPDSVQSDIYVGCPGPSRRAEGGWAPYPVLSHLVGGTPNARLDAVLREEKGYTYGIRSGFHSWAVGGVFAAVGSVRTEVTADALRLLAEILLKAREGFGEEETAAGVAAVSRAAIGRYTTADAIADEAAYLVLDGLDPSFVTEHVAAVAQVTPDQLREAYDQWVDGRFTVVVVGRSEAYADAVAALGLGPVVQVRDED